MNRRWYALTTSTESRLRPGQLIAHDHAVWRVVAVEDADLTDADRDEWLDQGMPDLESWHGRPYTLTLDWVGGACPPWAETGVQSRRGTITAPAGAYLSWNVYPGERWPQCSCCGEPMPCRAELEDRQVTAGLDRIAKLEAIPPGACWACNEPITGRQQAITYPGDNVDLPGGQQPTFHTGRRHCLPSAHAYEERWLAADPSRARILTWPPCNGSLIVHADGSSECFGGSRDCHGHSTHDHMLVSACYTQSHGCGRGCSREGHPGCRPTPRPERRQGVDQGLVE